MAVKKKGKRRYKNVKSNNLTTWRKVANFLTNWSGGFAFISSLNNKDFKESHNSLTIGQKSADWLTTWAGSWGFILGLLFCLLLWICVNVYFLVNYGKKVFDPYPFILLNLILSCLAALQAPIILMSQNRQQERDRAKAERDYGVNRKSEREVKKVIGSLKYIEGVLREKKK